MKMSTSKNYAVVRKCIMNDGWSDEGNFSTLKQARKRARLEKENYPSQKIQIWKEVTTVEVIESIE